MKKILQLVIGIALAVALLALSLGVRVSLKGGWPVVSSSMDLPHLWQLTLAASPARILAAIAVGLFGHNLLRAWRWRLMLSPEKRGIGLYNLFSTTVIGYAASWALPFRVGEVLRPMLLAEREKIRVSPALTTIVVERFLDGFALIVLFTVSLAFWGGREGIGEQGERILDNARRFSLLLLAATVVLFGLLAAGAATRGRWKGRVERFADSTRSRLAARLARAAIGLVEGGLILTRPAGFAGVLLLSLAIWIVIGWANWLGLRAGGVTISFSEGFILLPAMALGIGVPTPGGAGSFEYFVSQSLQSLFRQSPETAMAGTLVLHVAVTIIPVVLTGLALAWWDGLSPARLKAALAAAAGGPPGSSPASPGVIEEAAP